MGRNQSKSTTRKAAVNVRKKDGDQTTDKTLEAKGDAKRVGAPAQSGTRTLEQTFEKMNRKLH